ncbi:MAG: AAA family ATPase [Acidimicrobiia bacterium]|nr:AAA family ATPase [Acidimicrobiia bacterium]
MRPDSLLLERTLELASVDEAVNAAWSGDGRVLVVEGPAGIGKTSLLGEAGRRASDGGMRVLSAQGAVLERDFGFGAVRQLFEPVLSHSDADTSRRLLGGAASLARPVVSPDAEPTPAQQSAVMHGLYWFTSNLAELGPLLVVIDDVHWCDEATLQFLVYLARRIEGMPVAVIVAVRTGDPQAETPVVAELIATPVARVVRPVALSVDGVRQLIAEHLGPPTATFVDACRQATGGVPFLVEELVRVLRADGVQPTDAAAVAIGKTGPRTVAHATMLRLSRLPPSAASAARAVAVLEPRARLDRVATLADADIEEAQTAVEALAAMEVLAPGDPLRFTHPLVRQAVYDDMSPSTRAGAHGRVADILLAEGEPADEVAAQLLLSGPAGRRDVVETLRAAARLALAKGAPASAVASLRRALAEGAAPGEEHVTLLYELGGAEAFARDPNAAGDLAAARQLSDDPVQRARIGWALAEFQLLSGAWGPAVSLVREVLAELGDRDPDVQARLEGLRAANDAYDPAQTVALDDRLPRLRSLVDTSGPGTRTLALVLAILAILRGGDLADARELIERGLDEGRLLRDEGSESLALAQGIGALISLDDIEGAEAATAGVFDDARRRGSVLGYIAGCYYRTWIDSQRGRLHVAETYLRSVFEQSLEHGVTYALPSVIWAGQDVLLERAGVGDIVDFIESVQLDASLLATISGAWVLIVRGRLRLLQGRRMQGIADLRAAGQLCDATRLINPITVLWRSPLALALAGDDIGEAKRLVASELETTHRLGLTRCEGVTLRASGVIEGGSSGVDLLRRSLACLERVDAPLERARTLVELGAAQRRLNQRVAARDPLTQGLDLAHVCGAERLAARAIEELRASGARPRRRRLSGPEGLTSAEARVARMAADGMTNREIAQALFVTTKTVENQLTTVYRKLDVRSRDKLSEALTSESG